MEKGQQTQEQSDKEKIDEVLSAITDPRERAEKEQLLKTFIQLGNGSNKAHKVVERRKAALADK